MPMSVHDQVNCIGKRVVIDPMLVSQFDYCSRLGADKSFGGGTQISTFVSTSSMPNLSLRMATAPTPEGH